MKRTYSQQASASSAAPLSNSSAIGESETKRPRVSAAPHAGRPGRPRRKFGPTLEGFVDVKSSANTKLWLVKIPVPLAEHWATKEPNSILGSLRIEQTQQSATNRPSGSSSTTKSVKPPPKISFKLEDNPKGIREGTLNFTTPPPLCVLKINIPQQQRYKEELKKLAASKEANGGGSTTGTAADDDGFHDGDEEEAESNAIIKTPCIFVHGTVDKMLNMTPKLDTSYGRLVKEREDQVNTKVVKMQETDKEVVPGLHQMSKVPMITKKEKSEAVSKDKKARKPKEELMQEVFALFEKQAFWSLSELSEETQQPVSYLKKEILEEICEYNKRGTNKGKYELKDQYKTTSVSESGEQKNEEDEWM